MKKRLIIKNISSILIVFGFALLFLLAPCKIRNFIEAELGIPQTNVLNKNQSANYQLNCQLFEVSEMLQTISKQPSQSTDFVMSETSHFEVTTHLFRNYLTPITSGNRQVPDVPLYILYQNFLVYS